MRELLLISLLAVLVQFLVDRIKTFLPKKIKDYELIPIYSAIIGVIIATVTEIDILTGLGFEPVGIVGFVITGLVISGGSEAVHELISKLRESRNDELE